MSTAGLPNNGFSLKKCGSWLLHGALAVSRLSELRFRSDKLYEPSNKGLGHSQTRNASKRNKAQLHGPSVRSFEELWLAQHTVRAHPKMMIFGSSTLGLNNTLTLIPVIQQSFNSHSTVIQLRFVIETAIGKPTVLCKTLRGQCVQARQLLQILFQILFGQQKYSSVSRTWPDQT